MGSEKFSYLWVTANIAHREEVALPFALGPERKA